MQHAEQLRRMPTRSTLWHDVYQPREFEPNACDSALYEGFVNNDDRRLLEHLSTLNGEQLATQTVHFDDVRLPELLFRYRARNFPDSLSKEEQQRWLQLRSQRLHNGAEGSRSLQDCFNQMDELADDADERTESILSELYDYATAIAP